MASMQRTLDAAPMELAQFVGRAIFDRTTWFGDGVGGRANTAAHLLWPAIFA
jgi:hypothetical protein